MKGTYPERGGQADNDRLESDRAEQSSFEIFYSRLFISRQLNEYEIRDRWIRAIDSYRDGYDGSKFAEEFGRILGDIRAIALSFTQ
jgi:hypothetical protein